MFLRCSRIRHLLALSLTLAAGPVFGGNDKNYTYLALGDSLPFGFDPTVFLVGQPLPTPDKFTGYPEVVASVKHLLQSKKLVNVSCPGETSRSFLDANSSDNGCNGLGPQGQPPFKTSIGLHRTYTGPQVNFAVSELAGNKHINLVTLSIGGDDLLLVQQQCAHSPDFRACVAGMLPSALNSYGYYLTQILTALRMQAKYDGTLVLMKYYSPSADPLFIQAVGALNQVMEQVGAPFGVKFADGFTAFQLASALFQGDPCQAGLLVRLSPTTCDVHPSPAGRDLLAATVLLAIGDKH